MTVLLNDELLDDNLSELALLTIELELLPQLAAQVCASGYGPPNFVQPWASRAFSSSMLSSWHSI
jgi:hypothetical protein